MNSLSNQSSNRSYQSFRELVKIEWRLNLREPLGIIFGVGLPILLLIIFGNITKFKEIVQGTTLSLFDLYIPILMILVLIMIGLIGLPVPLARYREIGWLRRISTTPISPARLLLAQLIINLIIGVFAIVILLIGGLFIFGVKTSLQIPGFIVSIALATISMFSLGLLIAAISRTQRIAGAIANGFLYPFLFFSGIYVPVPVLPSYLQTICYLTPAGAAVQALTSSMHGSFPSVVPLLVMVIYSVFFIFISSRYFKWQ
jgi:ABC-2 type transport system permease protein